MYGKVMGSAPQGLESDRETFNDLTVLLPSNSFAKHRDAEVVPLITRYKEDRSEDAIKELGAYIDSNWVTNPTLIDVDYMEATRNEREPWARNATDEDKVPSLESDPIELAAKMIPVKKNPEGVLDLVGKFFDVVALALIMMSKRLKIEALVGEMTDVMERVRYNCLEARSERYGGIDPSKFPRTYDRIHMSNIP